ncbi:MCP four helix bundle domain-containing protein [Maribacter dokdonensis]|uniref:hypothetical protein n=1 Tax=Maribacter dokdonensis TaxID=320912 RepID=UPI0007199A60|nr:hypothetical protein [Maribacter dokdonensis]KSA14472.1 hypothetical protein I600_1073 [Maribacter dokdonensis DSW-8]
MFSKLKTQQRMHAIFILGITFLLVLGSNRLYQRHFTTLQTTVNTVYEDRVKVQDFIYQLNNIFHEKELRLTAHDFILNQEENKKVENLLNEVALTELTATEYNTLNTLTDKFKKLRILEDKELQSNNDIQSSIRSTSLKTLSEIDDNLNILAKIQLEESKQLTQLSNKTLDNNILMSKLAFALLVLIGITLLALIFYPFKPQTVLE